MWGSSWLDFLRLLKLTPSIQALIEGGELSYGHGRALLALDSSKSLTDVVEAILKQHLSVRQTEAMVAEILNPERKLARSVGQRFAPDDANVRAAQDKLQYRLGLKVRIEDSKGRGRVIIEYSGVEDFDAILAALGG